MNNKQHKIAVCFSGLIRQLEYTHKRWKDYFDTFPCPYDIFAFTGEDSESYKMKKYFPQAIVKIKKDTPIDNDKNIIKNYLYLPQDKWRSKTFIWQIYKLKQVYILQKEYAKQNNTIYTILIRARTDVVPPFNYSFPSTIHMNTIYIPNESHFGGINDRLVFGNSQLMSIYMSMYDSYLSNIDTSYIGPKYAREYSRNVIYKHYCTSDKNKWYGNNPLLEAQMYLSFWLKKHSIHVTPIKLITQKIVNKKNCLHTKKFTFYHISDYTFPWYWHIKPKLLILKEQIKHTKNNSIIKIKHFLQKNRATKNIYYKLKDIFKK